MTDIPDTECILEGCTYLGFILINPGTVYMPIANAYGITNIPASTSFFAKLPKKDSSTLAEAARPNFFYTLGTFSEAVEL